MTSQFPSEMQAVRVVEFGKPLKLMTARVPSDLGPQDLLVKVAVASRCHTDSMVSSGIFNGKLPQTTSHEGSGTIAAIGSAVTTFQPGDRVMCGIPLHPCGTCRDCVGPESWRQYCQNAEGHVGVHLDGYMAEYVRVDARFATKLPSEVSFLSAAPLACAGRTIWGAVCKAGLQPGQTLALVGSGGGLGHLGIQFAKKAKQLRVVGIDARDEGLQLSKECGADLVLDARSPQEDVVRQVQAATGGHGADATIVLSDAATAAALSCAVTKMHGLVVQVAQPDEVVVPFREFVFRDIVVKGSLLCSPEESDAMLRAVAEFGVTVKTNPFYGLDKFEEVVALTASGKIKGKAVVVVDEKQIEADKGTAKC